MSEEQIPQDKVERRTSPCRGCGKAMVWVRSEETGKHVPLDPRAQVYLILREEEDGTYVAARDREAMVSHFQTCPKARDFTGKNKGEA